MPIGMKVMDDCIIEAAMGINANVKTSEKLIAEKEKGKKLTRRQKDKIADDNDLFNSVIKNNKNDDYMYPLPELYTPINDNCYGDVINVEPKDFDFSILSYCLS